jgi:DNA-binding NarL/FixJ family response regulator
MLAPITMPDENSHNLGTAAQQVRILIVEDHEPFRHYVSSTLQQQANVRIIGEAEDGLQAVQLAKVLQPDVIILDIGLPRLSGIEAGRQIRQVAAESRIIFLSQETSADVREEAWALGAWGYVVKAQAGHELIAAVQAVSQGRKFVGDGFNGRNNPTGSKEEPGE